MNIFRKVFEMLVLMQESLCIAFLKDNSYCCLQMLTRLALSYTLGFHIGIGLEGLTAPGVKTWTQLQTWVWQRSKYRASQRIVPRQEDFVTGVLVGVDVEGGKLCSVPVRLEVHFLPAGGFISVVKGALILKNLCKCV